MPKCIVWLRFLAEGDMQQEATRRCLKSTPEAAQQIAIFA